MRIEQEVGDGIIQADSISVLIVNESFQGVELACQEEINELISILKRIELDT